MKYLPTAFAQLQFAWKLYNYVLDDKIQLEDLDTSVTFQEDGMMFVLPDRIFETKNDMVLAFENHLTIAFGAAAITLNRSREEAGLLNPDPIVTEQDQFVALVYQIRNAFAHDIAEPKWEIRQQRYQRVYEVAGIRVDLTDMNGKVFDYKSIGGPETLERLKDYGETIWANAAQAA